MEGSYVDRNAQELIWMMQLGKTISQNGLADRAAVGWWWTSPGRELPGVMLDDSGWPKITIVTPSFNQEEFLEQTICSVLNQGYPNLEYIIMDGGSSDNSINIIKKYEKHLAYWVSEKDGGQYDAINKGFSRGTGDIMAWLNSDDMHCPWTLRTVGEVFSQFPEIDWLSSLYPGGVDCMGHCLQFGRLPGFSLQAFLDGAYLPRRYRAYAFIQQESTFWRRHLWEKAGGLASALPLAGDFDLWCRFYQHAELFGLDSPLAFFRLHGDQKSMHIEDYVREADGALTGLRRQLHWRPGLLRRLSQSFGLLDFPKLGGLLRKTCGYHGKRVHLQNPRVRDAGWVIQRYEYD